MRTIQSMVVAAAVAVMAAGPVAAQQMGNVAEPVPTGELNLGSVRIFRATMANGQPLAAGTYTLHLTPQTATPDVVGQTPTYERWVEFRRGGNVVGREVVSIVPAAEIAQVAEDTPPREGRAKVQMLKGNEFLRVWVQKNNNHYLVHLIPS